MIPFFKLVAIVFVTTLAMAVLTVVDGSGNSTARIFGVPLVSVMQDGARGIIALGQTDAMGVLVIAQAGMGIVAFCQIGLGVLFFLGQGGAGLFAICQIGIGLFFFVGQLGGGLQARGQGVFFNRAGTYFEEMNKEFGELLSFWDPAREPNPPDADAVASRSSVAEKQKKRIHGRTGKVE